MSFVHCLMSSSLYTRTALLVGRPWTMKPTAGTVQQLQRNINPFWSALDGCTTFLRGKKSLKTHKGVAKRFRVRGGSGHKRSTLVHMHSGAQHNTGYRSRAAINKLGQSKPVSNKKVERKMKMCLGIL